ncbi:hypothetical protein AGLY_011818 [Aphis glycines]|uniref:Uncharacterized protein n=1 Tax=Aphis glycines TaxID=307491 RepID=A0A6G0TBH3_APHGL|nr:hypothetical protein AGLY_011818 [Aphis glycines]
MDRRCLEYLNVESYQQRSLSTCSKDRISEFQTPMTIFGSLLTSKISTTSTKIELFACFMRSTVSNQQSNLSYHETEFGNFGRYNTCFFISSLVGLAFIMYLFCYDAIKLFFHRIVPNTSLSVNTSSDFKNFDFKRLKSVKNILYCINHEMAHYCTLSIIVKNYGVTSNLDKVMGRTVSWARTVTYKTIYLLFELYLFNKTEQGNRN